MVLTATATVGLTGYGDVLGLVLRTDRVLPVRETGPAAAAAAIIDVEATETGDDDELTILSVADEVDATPSVPLDELR